MTKQEFADSTNTLALTVLIGAAVYALRSGVDPIGVADRLQNALDAGYGHVPYNVNALNADVEDLS